jgi:hypothetical protein
LGSWQWRGARDGLQGLHARDRRYDGAHQGQQHRRQGRRQLGKLARGEAGTQPHRRRAGYALGGCGGSSSEPPEVTGRSERLSGSCRFRRSTNSKRTTAGRYGGTGAATANRKSRKSAKLQTGTRDSRCPEGKQWPRRWQYIGSFCGYKTQILCASGDKRKLRPESGGENKGNGNVWYGNEKSSVSYEGT